MKNKEIKIQVLGSGCPTCAKLNAIVRQAIQEIDTNINVEYLTGSEGISKIIKLGAVSSPVLTINDQVVLVGFNPDLNKIKSIIQNSINQK